MSHVSSARTSLLQAALIILGKEYGSPIPRHIPEGKSHFEPAYPECYRGKAARKMNRLRSKELIRYYHSRTLIKQYADAVRLSTERNEWLVRLNNGQQLVARTFKGMVKNLGGMNEEQADALWEYLQNNRNEWIKFVAETSSVVPRIPLKKQKVVKTNVE